MKKLIPILGIYWLLGKEWLDETSESLAGNIITIVLFMYQLGMFLAIMFVIITLVELYTMKTLVLSLVILIVICVLVLWIKYTPGRRKKDISYTTFLTRQIREM